MPLDFARARPLLQSCDLARLFVEELGWEPCRQKLTLRDGERNHAFAAIAEKRGFTAWLCDSADGHLPDHTTRLKLDRALAQTSFEHLIVFATPDRSHQSWLWVRREPGRPLSARTHEFSRGQPGDSLLQKLQHLFVSLEEEEAGLSVTEIAGRVRAAFDLDRVTKAFYRDFDTHRKAFLKFIEGIKDVADCQWYASVMLNRLMFVYFIQRKGFLDGDAHYLRNRLQRTRVEHGKDKFYSFYRYFLLRLFHEGLGGRKRTADLEKFIGRIPYLNGGMFDKHPIEERYPDIQIGDKAFERVFDYFDQYQWHLDERPLRADNEINPDVLGYIFEKYINQKQMGAYYTKEDITEYISKNTVIPFLFDKVAQASSLRSKEHRNQDGCATFWNLLRDDPDRYIYPAVRHGADKPLPPDIAAGVKDVSKRTNWNKPAPGEYALPTEIWREVIARRQRCFELRARLSGQPLTPALSPSDGERENRSQPRDKSAVASPPGAADGSPSPPSEGGEGRGEVGDSALRIPHSAIKDINDLITLNLDIRQFAQDVIVNCQDPALLAAFWHAINSITVLDPTGGSGAFVFAALNILEPLYEACLDRMEAFLAEWGEQGRKLHPNYHKEFTEVLARVAQHPNRRYFVLKSIIVNNLYAVDIMEEATEICKLRLFLKLAAQIDPDPAKENLGIEPLPDIDFNIRTGNTLVGYATADEVRRCMTTFQSGQMKLLSGDELASYERFTDKLQIADAAFRSFREQQTKLGGAVTAEDKAALKDRLKSLEDELNNYLARDYGVKVEDRPAYTKWLKSHQPFHWFIEFYGIVSKGGFDVIIGNPPFVENTPKNVAYRLRRFRTLDCGNLYAFVSERCATLLAPHGSFAFIMPSASLCTPRMQPLMREFGSRFAHGWISIGDERPSKLFDGVDQQLAIHIYRQGGALKAANITAMRHWASEEREQIFPTLGYTRTDAQLRYADVLPKVGSEFELRLLTKLAAVPHKTIGAFVTGGRSGLIYYRNAGGRYWRLVKSFPTHFRSDAGATRSSTEKEFSVSCEVLKPLVAVLSSTLYYWFWRVVSNCRHLTDRELSSFPVASALLADGVKDELEKLAERYEARLKESKNRLETQNQSSGEVVQDVFYVSRAKPILDEIDRVLARHYGFTAEELDFILNYDIKYRLGHDTEGEEE